MKNMLKMFLLIIVGLLTAIIIYPFLHESEHAIIALIVGAEITDLNLFLLPFVVCEVSKIDNLGQVLIGLGGIFIPFVISMSLKLKPFWMWYVNLLIKGISTYATLLSVIAILLHINGVSWHNKDIIQVLQISQKGIWLFLCVFVVMFVYGCFIIKADKPFIKLINHFNIADERG